MNDPQSMSPEERRAYKRRHNWIAAGVLAVMVAIIAVIGFAVAQGPDRPESCADLRAEQREITTDPAGMDSDAQKRYDDLIDYAVDMNCSEYN